MGRKRTLGGLLAILMGALAMTSCGAPAPTAPTTTKAAAIAPPTTAEILTTLMPSVVLLLTTHDNGAWRIHRSAFADLEASGLAPEDAKALAAKADAPGAREAWMKEGREASIRSSGRRPRAATR